MRRCSMVFVGFGVLAVVAACGVSQPPRYGVTSFRLAGPVVQGVPSMNFEEWRGQNLNVVIVEFVSRPGSFTPARFALRNPEGGVANCQFYLQPGDAGFKATTTFDPDTLQVIGPSISQISGDLQISLLFTIPGQPSTDYVLTYHDEEEERSYEILPGALQSLP